MLFRRFSIGFGKYKERKKVSPKKDCCFNIRPDEEKTFRIKRVKKNIKFTKWEDYFINKEKFSQRRNYERMSFYWSSYSDYVNDKNFEVRLHHNSVKTHRQNFRSYVRESFQKRIFFAYHIPFERNFICEKTKVQSAK